MSRTAVREAIRTLHEKGLVEAYTGRGTFITNGTSNVMRQSLDRMLKIGLAEGSAQLAEVRAILEPDIAGLAATRADSQHIALLREAVSTMDRSLENPEAVNNALKRFFANVAEGPGARLQEPA